MFICSKIINAHDRVQQELRDRRDELCQFISCQLLHGCIKIPVRKACNICKWPQRLLLVIILAGIAADVGTAFNRVCLSVCLFVCDLTGKRLELSTPNLVHVYSIAVAQHALTQRSKGQRSRSHGYENRHVRTVASDHPYFATQYTAVLPAAVAGVDLHGLLMFSSWNCSYSIGHRLLPISGL